MWTILASFLDYNVSIGSIITAIALLLGFGISTVFILYEWVFRVTPSNDKGFDEDLKEDLDKWLSENDEKMNCCDKLNSILKDYDISCSELRRRDNIVLVIGTIIITASLLIFGNAVNASQSNLFPIYAFASIVLYSIWLICIHWTSNKLDDIQYRRIKAMEKSLTRHLSYDFGMYSYIRSKISDKDYWLRLRRSFWDVILLLLSFAWLLMSLS